MLVALRAQSRLRLEQRTWALITEMLAACSYAGHRQGPRFVAFYGRMYYAMMRPAEVAALTRDGCHLPEYGWGRLGRMNDALHLEAPQHNDGRRTADRPPHASLSTHADLPEPA